MNQILIYILLIMAGAITTSVIFLIIMRKRERDITDLTILNQRLTTEKELMDSQLSTLKEESAKQLTEAKVDAANLLAMVKEEAARNIALSEERGARQLKEQMEALKLVFGQTADKIFEQKSQSLSDNNEKGIKSILDPLKEKMEEFKKEVLDTKEKSIKTNASLEEQIKSMMEKAASLGSEANNLASALKGSNKIQGNWGETHLEKLLQDAGFSEGIDYEKQATIRNAAGEAIRHEETESRLVPDITLTFPDKKVAVIDSKVSLTAYMDYCREDISENERNAAAAKHIESVRSHIKELTRKDYASGLKRSDKNSLKYVIMYIPNEIAFQLFFKDNQQEWRKAFDNGVIVIGDLYLITMLKIIRLTWDADIRQKNTEKITLTASELLNRVGEFIRTFEGIGSDISKMEKSFDKAKAKLLGRQSIASTSRKLQGLGIECKNPITSSGLLIEDGDVEPTPPLP